MKIFDMNQNMIGSRKMMAQNLEGKMQLLLAGWNTVGVSNLPHIIQSKVPNKWRWSRVEASQPASVRTLQSRELGSTEIHRR